MRVNLEKGTSRISVDIPGHQVAGVLEGNNVPALGHDAVERIIARGIRDHAPPGLESGKIAVVIPDDTRLWARGDRFVPGIITTLLEMEAAPDRITVIIALGTHRPITAKRFATLCGAGTASRVRVVNSAGLSPDRLVPVGTTSRGTELAITREAAEADHIIIFGGILHHMLAGYGGGRKYILPGIAGEAAIQANHSLAVDAGGIPRPLVRQAVLEGNPVSEDMKEGADLFLNGKTCTYAAVAANGQGEIFFAEAGGLHPTFDRGCRALDRACCVRVGKKADFVLFSAGGHRTDSQLYQATKALFNAVGVAKEGGSLLFVAGCGQGTGNPEFEAALAGFRNSPGELGRNLARKFRMPAYVALRVLDMLNRFEITLVSDLGEAVTRALGFGYTSDPQAWVSTRSGKGYVIPYAENILPRAAAD